MAGRAGVRGATSATAAPLPPLPSHFLPRERLRDQLDAATAGRHVLLAAPAGHGKTTLASAWCRDRGHRTAWVTFDRWDDRPERVLARVVDALREAVPELGLPDADSTATPEDRARAVLTCIAGAGVPDVLVLDDLDVLTVAPAGDLVRYLVTWMPEPVRCVLISRADPLYLPLGRWRWRDRLTEVRAPALAFTAEETATYLTDPWGLRVDRATSDRICDSVSGWPAAVHLVAVRLAAGDTGSAVGLLGADAGVSGLLEGVLERETAADRTFLMATAVLDELTPGACRAVSGTPATERLARLAARGLVVRAGEAGTGVVGYRHHRLLRELLLGELRLRSPEELPRLHRRAARWFAAQGRLEPALRHGLAGGRRDLVADQLEGGLREVAALDGGATLAEAVSAVGVVPLLPRQGVLEAFLDLAFVRGEAAAVETVLTAAEAADRHGRDRVVARGRLYLARLRGDDPSGVPGAADDPVRVHVSGTAAAWDGRHAEADARLRAALDDAVAHDEPTRQLAVLADLCVARVTAGALNEADLLVRRAARLASSLGITAPPVSLRLATARLALERGLGALAARRAAGAVAAARDAQDLPLALEAELLAARIADGTGSHAVLERLVACQSGMPAGQWGAALHGLVRRREAALRLAVGDPGGAAEAVPALREAAARPGAPEDHVLSARFLAADGRPGEALREAVRARRSAHAPRVVLEASQLESQLAERLGDPVRAAAAAARARRVAASQGMRPAHPGSAGPAPAITRRAARPADPAAPTGSRRPDRAARPSPPGSLDGLTDRELDVLRLLGSGRPYRLIAESLQVSVNTVKTHLKSIYRKLEVESRFEAVTRAHEVGLL